MIVLWALLVSAPSVNVAFEARELANLSSHLDCLAGVRRCARKAYLQLWQRDIGLNDADQRMLEEWRQTIKDPGQEWSPSNPRPDTTYPLPVKLLQPGNAVRMAALQARDIGDYEERLQMIVEPPIVGKLSRILRHFQPRFRPFYQRSAGELDRAAKAADALTREKSMSAFIDKVAAFYGADLPPGHTVHASLVFRPKAASRTTHAEHLSGFLLVEVVDGEPMEERLPIVLHELFHYFYGTAPDSVHAEVIDAFGRSKPAEAFNVYALMNEALATALGNGVGSKKLAPQAFEKALSTVRGLCNDEVLDRAAKAVLPIAEAWVERGEKLSSTQATTYLGLMSQTFGDRLKIVGMSLRTHVIVYTGQNVKALLPKIVELTNASDQFSFAPFDSPDAVAAFFANRDATGIMLMTKAELPRLQAWQKHLGQPIIDRIDELAGKYAGFIYGVRRTDKAITYLVVGETDETLMELLPKLTAMPEAFTGPGPSIKSEDHY